MLKIFKNDLKLFFKDTKSVVLTFLLPIILITLFAFAFGGMSGKRSGANPIDLIIVDEDQSVTSKSIIVGLDSLTGLSTKHLDNGEAVKLISKGKYPAALVFHEGFEKSVASKDVQIELLYDKSKEMETGLLQPILIQAIMSVSAKEAVAGNIKDYFRINFPDLDPTISDKVLNDMNSDNGGGPEMMMDPQIKMTSIIGETKDVNLGLIQAVAGTAILMLLFSVAGIGASILEEKEGGTLNRLLVSPLTPNAILFGKMLTTFFIALLQLIVMFLFAWLVLGLNLLVNVPAVILMIIATAFAVSSFGIFLAAISKTRQQAQSLGTLIILIMSAIGGSMIPLFIMPAIMKKIAMFSVNYWGIQGFYDIFWRDLPTIEVLPRVFVLLGIGIVMTLISLRLFRKNVVKLV